MSRRYRHRYENFWPVYVPVAERRAKAERTMDKLRKKGEAIQPITLEGRTIARTFWGKGWCDHLESFGDYSNRLPRGRSYVRNGAVCHLDIARGRVAARVAGSRLYSVDVAIQPLAPRKWQALKRRCAGRIGSLIALLQGKLSEELMGTVTDRKEGLFPLPGEIRYTCSCPDWADMCKHVSAVMYGIGARLDEQPELLFLLRGVDHDDLISAEPAVAATLAQDDTRRTRRRKMADTDLAAVFGVTLEDDTTAVAEAPASAPRKRATPSRRGGARTKRPRADREPKAPTPCRKAAKKTAPKAKPVPFEATGPAVARLRARLAMTVAAFARAVGVSPASVTNWERRDGVIRPHARGLAGLRRLHDRTL